MKIIPFDIEKAKSGKYKIQTKDGKNVRIVCWDRKCTTTNTIIALIDEGDFERTIRYTKKGHQFDFVSEFDLVLIDESVTPYEKVYATLKNVQNIKNDQDNDMICALLAGKLIHDIFPKWKFIKEGEKLPKTSLVMDKKRILYGLLVEKGTKLADDFWYLPIKEIENLGYEI